MSNEVYRFETERVGERYDVRRISPPPAGKPSAAWCTPWVQRNKGAIVSDVGEVAQILRAAAWSARQNDRRFPGRVADRRREEGQL